MDKHQEASDQPEQRSNTPLPTEGGIYERDGRRYRFVPRPTGKQAYDHETGETHPMYYTLKTWFSHSTPGVTSGGPGWDYRLRLLEMTDADMRARYGHVFTESEVMSPSGERQADGSFVGGMPDDILYYDLEKIEDDPTGTDSKE